MKLSSGTIGTVLFTAAGVAAFAWMALRPAVEGNAMNFGMPLATASSVEKTVEEKMPEATVPTTEEAAMPVTTPETSMPSSTESTTEATPEIKTEEMPAAPSTDLPADAPAAN